MTEVLAVCVAVTFATSIYMLLSRELKAIAMGVFLLGHAANLCLIAQSGPAGTWVDDETFERKRPPILTQVADMADPLASVVDPLPQALLLTAIVISFGVMAFVLTMVVVTSRQTGTLDTAELAEAARADDHPPDPPATQVEGDVLDPHNPDTPADPPPSGGPA